MWARSEWSSPKRWVNDDRRDENVLICHRPAFFEAIQDGGTCNDIFWASHFSVPHNERPEGQEDGVKAAMSSLSDVRRNSEWFEMVFHPT